MNAPRRLLDGGGTDLERLLVASGRSARPGGVAKARTGLLLALVSFGVAPSVVSSIGTWTRRAALTRWLVVGIGIAATVGVVRWVGARHPTSLWGDARARGPSTAVVERGAEMADLPVPSLAPSASAVAIPSSDGLALSGAPPSGLPVTRPQFRHGEPGTAALSTDDLRALDAARGAISAGDPAGALERLDAYARLHPRGAFEQEQLRLRVEALVALGRTDSARALVRKFLRAYPESPHRKRLQSLVGAEE